MDRWIWKRIPFWQLPEISKEGATSWRSAPDRCIDTSGSFLCTVSPVSLYWVYIDVGINRDQREASERENGSHIKTLTEYKCSQREWRELIKLVLLFAYGKKKTSQNKTQKNPQKWARQNFDQWIQKAGERKKMKYVCRSIHPSQTGEFAHFLKEISLHSPHKRKKKLQEKDRVMGTLKP